MQPKHCIQSLVLHVLQSWQLFWQQTSALKLSPGLSSLQESHHEDLVELRCKKRVSLKQLISVELLDFKLGLKWAELKFIFGVELDFN